MRRSFALFMGVLLLLATQRGSGAVETKDRLEPIRKAAVTFYGELRKERIEGLPNQSQLQRLAPLITPELHALLVRAAAEQARQMKEHPDDKPDWIEGDLFGSLFEGIKDWALGEVKSPAGGDGATVEVKLRYTEPGQAPVEWSDTLVWTNRDGKWLLDDIRMGGKWAFGGGGTLRQRLAVKGE